MLIVEKHWLLGGKHRLLAGCLEENTGYWLVTGSKHWLLAGCLEKTLVTGRKHWLLAGTWRTD